MVRCPVCNRITRFDPEKCLECGHAYSEAEAQKLAVDEKNHWKKMKLREKLKDRAYRCDFIGTICLVLSLALIGPAMIKLIGFFKARSRVGVSSLSDYAMQNLIVGIVYSTLVVLLFAAALILFWIKRRTVKKTNSLRSV